MAKATGCKNTSTLTRLPHHNYVTQTMPDMMHTVKDAVEKMFHLIVTGPVKALLALNACGQPYSLWQIKKCCVHLFQEYYNL